jgi:hypothetical protein
MVRNLIVGGRSIEKEKALIELSRSLLLIGGGGGGGKKNQI